jgi:hypothetical protein
MTFRMSLRCASKVSDLAQHNVLHHTVATNDYQALEGFFQLITFDFDVASEF